ncbi:MAG: M42 family metallopeptidase [Clostridia bacterium]|nr:M42 family metallopeptidase [Clostridia bacterium]
MIDLIEKLSLLNGISGRENEVRDFIINEIKDYADSIETDPLGNLIVFKKGVEKPKNKVMLDAHMDEVGMMITAVNGDGTLEFECVGGIDKRVMLGRAVTVGKENIAGVIGVKPIHMVSADSKLSMPEHMYIDIGADNKEEAEKAVCLGEYACFNSEFVRFGDGFIKGKALDDRAGCAMLIEMIKSDLPYDMYFNFATGEEVGLGLAGTAAYRVNPDYAIVVETTTAADLADVPENQKVCRLGKGAVISFMDRRTIYPKALFDRAFELANEYGVKAQVKAAVAGGNNAGIIHKTAGGVKTITVSLPCRYLHSPSCVLNKEDIFESLKMIKLLAEDFANA